MTKTPRSRAPSRVPGKLVGSRRSGRDDPAGAGRECKRAEAECGEDQTVVRWARDDH